MIGNRSEINGTISLSAYAVVHLRTNMHLEWYIANSTKSFSSSTFMSLRQHISVDPLSLSCLMVLHNGVLISLGKLIERSQSQLIAGNVAIIVRFECLDNRERKHP